MQIIRSEQTSFWDIDGTLIVKPSESPTKVQVKDPIEDRMITLGVHEPMIRLMKEEAHRGAFIVVWSRGGHEWAEAVIKALGLTDIVDIVMSKPMAYFDDSPIEKWLPYRVFLEPNCEYKK